MAGQGLIDRLTGPATFCERAGQAFRSALANAAPVERWYELAGWRVRIVLAGPALVPGLTRALDHRALKDPLVEGGGVEADLTICAWDTASTGVRLPPAGWPNTAYGAKGLIDGFNTERYSTVFAPGVDLFSMLDRERQLGFYWIDDATDLPYWESGFPFRTLLHWRSSGTPIQLVHSGAVGAADRGVLLCGVGGSGKSTTTLLCMDAGLAYAGDDYVAIDSVNRRVHSLYSSAKVDPVTLDRFPHLRGLVANAAAADAEKALLYLHPERERCLTADLDLAAILLPRVMGTATTELRRASPVAAIHALAPTTVFQLPGQGDEAFAKVCELAHGVPAYHLLLGRDRDRIPGMVLDVIKGP